ncbi:unnamed protein product [Amoebophrya sp. A25]|nr:unnamed protein product [Amoebophrya sp. A25]|eukprot:GSA25T00000367001.1
MGSIPRLFQEHDRVLDAFTIMVVAMLGDDNALAMMVHFFSVSTPGPTRRRTSFLENLEHERHLENGHRMASNGGGDPRFWSNASVDTTASSSCSRNQKARRTSSFVAHDDAGLPVRIRNEKTSRNNATRTTSFFSLSKTMGMVQKFATGLSKSPLQVYRMVTLYPQSHHPALATQPLVLQSHSQIINPNEDEALREDYYAGTDPITGKEVKTGGQMRPDSGGDEAGREIIREKRDQAEKPFGNPMDRYNTQVLFPVPMDW